MNTENRDMSSLPKMAMKEIPTPGAGAEKIVALVKERGKISGYQLSDGRVLSKSEGVDLARQGGIQGVGISSRNGTEYLKSVPDGTEGNNLNALPTMIQW